jgi:conjugative relaxase-like TrwC/TraI family protein
MIDPQLHTHNPTANLTYDGVEKRWKALQMGTIFRQVHYLTEVYRNEYARSVREAGFEVEYRWNFKKTQRNMEIKGISEPFCYDQSRMAQLRDKAVADSQRGNDPPSPHTARQTDRSYRRTGPRHSNRTMHAPAAAGSRRSVP